ncbi:MAG: AAA family ATPase [Candidatus Coatesbacteria bacterium]|nr:AAA family ATPase [Candidatus Coatesbacteria bacterium]
MFKEIRVKNFRTHVDTALRLGPITLLIGPNNAGKTNLLEGINHFSRLIARADRVSIDDLWPHIHRLAPGSDLSASWTFSGRFCDMEYAIDLYHDKDLENYAGCKEKIRFKMGDRASECFESGWHFATDYIRLQRDLATKPNDGHLSPVGDVFQDIASCSSYHFQPAFLKREVGNSVAFQTWKSLNISAQLGYRGEHLQEVLHRVQQEDQRTYNRFVSSLRRFEPSFQGLGYDEEREQTTWLFDLGRVPPQPDEFPPELVSDGVLRAAAIALLSSMERPPALIMIEEIENGISQKNLGRFMGWLREAAGLPDSSPRGYSTQFILTSHSPSVLFEFSEHLDDVYYMRLERRGYKSVVRNLNSALLGFVDLGTVDGEIEDRDGEKVVRLSPQDLLTLWYSGVIGGEPVNGQSK